jgi:hypothetical protein
VEYLDRFKGQTLYKIKASRFREAIEEAFLAERGLFELETDEGCSLEKSVNDQSIPDGLLEGSGSNNEQECQSEAQVVGKSPGCDICGNRLPCKIASKKKQAGERLLCRHCDKLLQSKQYCGICKKIWHHTDGGNWVRARNICALLLLYSTCSLDWSRGQGHDLQHSDTLVCRFVVMSVKFGFM